MQHGGALDEARATFGDGPAPWLDLSTGINPHAWPAEGVAIDWRRLPEAGAIAELETAAAGYFGVDRHCVAAVPGSEIGLRLLGRVLRGPAWHVSPTYRTHVDMLPESRPLAPHDLAAVGDGVIVLANPNNPDGRIIAARDLLAAPSRLRDGCLIVDEAFADADPLTSIAPQVHDGARLIVTRSFGKFFGLAGMRLGFVIAPPAILARLRAALGAWPVSAAAVAIGTAAYRDAGWIVTMRARLAAEATALDAVLRRCGVEPIGACPLFRLITVADAAATFARLARAAILTRPFAEQPHGLRIGLPADEAALARLERALRDG